jgi:hypothetical protein
MTSFDEREKGFEAKFKHDQETLFKIHARRNKLLGLWAAELMELGLDAAAAYAREVVAADFEEPGVEDVIRKLLHDFEAKGIDVGEHRVRKELQRFEAIAAEQISKQG